MTIFSRTHTHLERRAARTRPVANRLAALTVALLAAATLVSPSAAQAGPSVETLPLLFAEARHDDARNREAERAERFRRELQLERSRDSHEEWQRQLRDFRLEQRYQPLDLDVPVYQPRPSNR